MEKRKILFVDDDIGLLDEYLEIMTDHGYEVMTAENGSKAWEIFQKSVFLVVITDLRMPDVNGLFVLENIKRFHPPTQVIIVSAHGEKEDAIKALRLNASDYVVKGSQDTIPTLLNAIDKAFTQAETQIKTEKKMLSFLTHTLRNTLSGGPQTVDQILRLLQNVFGDKYQDPSVSKIAKNIASLHSIFTSVNNMLETYKFYVSEPGKINQNWKADVGGSIDLNYLFFLVIKQILGRMLFEEQNLDKCKKLLEKNSNYSIKETRNSFISNVLLLEGVQQNFDQLLKWLNDYLPIVSITIQNKNLKFNADGIRFNILFSCISEIVYNAMKYTDTDGKIRIKWNKKGNEFIFTCRNSFSTAGRIRTGTQKGLSFISGLMNMVNGSHFLYDSENSTFSVQLTFEENLLIGGSENEIFMD